MSTIGYYICVPFAWVLRTFYELTGSYGWALVLFTIVVKLITLPFQMKSKKSMMRMNLFQPKVKEIQTKYANNPTRMNEEMQLLYTQEGVNPMSGCLWSFLPFPILIALYSIIRQPLSRFMMLSKDVVTEITTLATTLGYNAELVRKGYEEIGLAKFISDNFADFSGKFDGLLNVNYNFLGLDLTVMPGDVWKDFFTGGWPVIGVVLIPFISGALSFLQSKASMAGNVAAEGNDAAARSSRMMMWMMPLMSLWIGFTLPAALGVYWIVNSPLYAIQEKVLTKYYKSHMEDELSEKEKQKRDDRLRRMEAAREQQRKRREQQASLFPHAPFPLFSPMSMRRAARAYRKARTGKRPPPHPSEVQWRAFAVFMRLLRCFSVHQDVVFHEERGRRILSPAGVVLCHEIAFERGAAFKLRQAVRLLKGDLFDKIKPIVPGGKEHADVSDEERILRFGKTVVEDDGDHAAPAV